MSILKQFRSADPILLKKWLWLFAGALVVTWSLAAAGAFTKVGNIFYDYVQHLVIESPDKNIIVVGIDEGAINELGGWPIPRIDYADFLLHLAQTGNSPRAVGLDLLMLDPTPDDYVLWSVVQSTGAFVATQIIPGDKPGESIPQTLAIGPSRGSELIAHVNFVLDDDGLIRSVNLFDSGVPHLAMAMAVSEKIKDFNSEDDSLRRFKLVNPRAGFTTISLGDALSPNYPLSTFKDAYVLIGVTVQSLADRYASSNTGQKQTSTARVIYTASVLNAILQDHLVTVAPLPVALPLYGFVLMAVLLVFLLLPPSLELVVSASLFLACGLSSAVLLSFKHYWLDPGPVLIAIPLIKPLWSWIQMRTIVSFVQEKTHDLGMLQPLPSTRQSKQGTFDQTAAILDAAILETKNRFDNLKQVVDNLPEPILVIGADHRVRLYNDKFKALFAADIRCDGALFDELLVTVGSSYFYLNRALQGVDAEKYLTLTDSELKARKFLPNRVDMIWNRRDTLSLIMLVDLTAMLSLQNQRDRTLQLLSHDMRTPVSGILMLCRESGLDPAAVIWTQQVSQQARQTLEMMDGFIHAIRADAERYELTQQFFDSLLEQSLHEVRTLANERGNTFDVDQGAFLYLMCDPRLIERVLVNLFVNAIRYSLMNTTITVRVTVDADETDRPYLVCRIENVINDEAQQGPKEIEQKGFGLGLAFVQQVVNGHAGTFEQDFSGPNGLAVVTLRLPCLALI